MLKGQQNESSRCNPTWKRRRWFVSSWTHWDHHIYYERMIQTQVQRPKNVKSHNTFIHSTDKQKQAFFLSNFLTKNQIRAFIHSPWLWPIVIQSYYKRASLPQFFLNQPPTFQQTMTPWKHACKFHLQLSRTFSLKYCRL